VVGAQADHVLILGTPPSPGKPDAASPPSFDDTQRSRVTLQPIKPANPSQFLAQNQ
jgi:hypothetical protein